MSRHEIHHRLGLIDETWWGFMPGEIVTVKWPSGELEITPDHPLWDWSIGPDSYRVNSADPNEWYRPWLEKHVGRQGWDWNWRIAPVALGCYSPGDRLVIKLRKKKAHFASMISLMWG